MTGRELPKDLSGWLVVIGRRRPGDEPAGVPDTHERIVEVDTFADLAGADLSGVRGVVVYDDVLDEPLAETLIALRDGAVSDIHVVTGAAKEDLQILLSSDIAEPYMVSYVASADVPGFFRDVGRFGGGGDFVPPEEPADTGGGYTGTVAGDEPSVFRDVAHIVLSGGGGAPAGETLHAGGEGARVPLRGGEILSDRTTVPDQLYWNTRFPGNEAVLDPAGQPGVVIVGRVYVIETALDTEPAPDVSTPAGPAADFAGTEATFELRAVGAELSAEDADDWSERLSSTPLPCGVQGTEPFRVRLRVREPGFAAVDLRLVTRNEIQLTQRIELAAVAAPAAHVPPVGTPTSEPAAPSVDSTAFRRAIGATVRITVDDDPGMPTLAVESPGCALPVAVANGRDAIANTVAALQFQLVNLARKYPDGPGPLGEFDIGDHADEVRVTFATAGARLHAALFGLPSPGSDSAAAAQCLALEGSDGETTMQVADDAIALPVPWGLLYDARAYAEAVRASGGTPPGALDELPTSPDCVDETRFWGRRFIMSRYYRRPFLPPVFVEGIDGVQLTAVVNKHLGDTVVGNQLAMLERAAVRGLAGEPPLVVDPVISHPEALLAWARAGDTSPSDALYFFCHARGVGQFAETGFPAPAADPASAALGLAAEDTGAPVTLEALGYAWGRPRERRPLVLLNACGSTQADAVYGLPFVRHFMGAWQARAFVGTDWAVPTQFADPFSRRIFDALRRGLSILAAVREASIAAFDQGNLYPLIYAVYGLPTLSLTRRD